MSIPTKQDIRHLVRGSHILSPDCVINLAAQGSGSNLWLIHNQSQDWMLKQPRAATAELAILQQWQQYGQAADMSYLLLPQEIYPATESCPLGGWLLPYLKNEVPASVMAPQACALAQLHRASRQWQQYALEWQQISPIDILKQWIEGWLILPHKFERHQDQQIAQALWAEYQALSELGTDIKLPVLPVLCHRDLVAENWLFHTQNNNIRACLIDWEWADWQHPAWDLAFWIAEIPKFWGGTGLSATCWDLAEQQQALSLYHQQAPEMQIAEIYPDIERLKPWINLGCLSWGFWQARQWARQWAGQLANQHGPETSGGLALYQAKIRQFDQILPNLLTYLTIVPDSGSFDGLATGFD